jgi:hypothetical protein
MTRRYRDLMTRALPQLHECRGVTEELLTRRRQGSSTLVPNEQRPSELLLEGADAGAHGRLSDVQPLGSSDEAPGRNDLKKGPSYLGVHV